MSAPATVLYGCAVVLSSFLLFLIQPIIAKIILPWFGGSAAVWITCLVFFQTALVLGYLYAHWAARRLAARTRSYLHIALLAAAVLTLPPYPGAAWNPASGADPTWRILGLLAVVTGLPYVLLSSTSPLLQSWYAGAHPYRLFAWSNAGAVLALASYPFLIEPRLPARLEASIWSIGFAVFAVACSAVAWGNRAEDRIEQHVATEHASRRQWVLWTTLAAAGSMLLLATTNQITQNVAAVPFLWILPLTIYLLTFVICFEKPAWYRRGFYLRLLAVAIGSVGFAVQDIDISQTIAVSAPVLLFGLFAGCMYCHGELSSVKPDKALLTTYYVAIAVGGAVGAVLVGLAAPRLFTGVYELPLALMAVAALALSRTWDSGWQARVLWIAVTATAVIVLAAQVRGYHKNALTATRSFYGALRVVENGAERALYHGTVKHGSQFLDEARQREPTTYYGRRSGVGLAMRYCCAGAKRVAMIGLGAGTLASYGNTGDFFRFYEVNPQVIQIAGSYFTYLRNTPAKVGIIAGDARLSLERESGPRYDLLVADAFSGDAIPMHLLTREAFTLYFGRLTPEGVLAVHVSNQYLDLAPVAKQAASALGYEAIVVESAGSEESGVSAAQWVLATRNQAFLSRPEVVSAARSIKVAPGVQPWTDEYNNLFEVLRLPGTRL